MYTLRLTILSVSYWLHPFGPLTKNILSSIGIVEYLMDV